MRAVIIALGSVVAVGVASAQPHDDRSLATAHRWSIADTPTRQFAWDLSALVGSAVDVGRAGGVANATASVAGALWSRRGHDALGTGGQLDLHARATAPFAFEHWATVDRTAGPVTALRVTHRFAWDVVPRLLATPRVRGDGFRGEAFDLAFTLLAYVEFGNDDTSTSAEVFPLESSTRYHLSRSRGATGDGAVRTTMFRWRSAQAGRITRETAIVAVDYEVVLAWGADDLGRPVSVTGMAANLDFVRLRRTAGAMQWNAGGGVAMLLSDRSSPPEGSQACLDSGGAECPPARPTLVGHLGFEWPALGGAAAFTLRRQPAVVFDASIVVDNRATLSVTRDRERWHARAAIELAWDQLTTHAFADHASASYAVGGVTGEVEYHDDDDRFAVRGYLEAGRSVLAPGASLVAPTLGATVGVSLHLRTGTR